MLSTLKRLCSQEKKKKETATVELSQILSNSDDSLGVILQTINQALPLAPNTSQAGKHIAIGRALALAALVQSPHLQKAENDAIISLVKNLIPLRMDADESSIMSVQTIVYLISITSTESFKLCIWPQIAAILSLGWKDCDFHRLHIMLTCVRFHKLTMKDSVMNAWGSDDLLSTDNYQHIITLLKNHKSTVPAMNAIIDHVFTTNQQFWSSVSGVLFKSQSPEVRDIGISLLNTGIVKSTSPKQLIQVLCPEFFLFVTNSLNPGKRSKQPENIKHLLSNLVDKVVSSDDFKLQSRVVSHILKSNEFMSFDEMTKTRTLSSIVHGVTRETIEWYSQTLQDLLLNDEKNMNLRIWAMSQLTSLITSPSVASNDQFHVSLLVFFTKHALFVEENRLSLVDDQLRKVITNHLFKALDVLTTLQPLGQRHNPTIYINKLYSLVSSIQEFMDDDNWRFVTQPDPQMMIEWKSMLKRVHKIHKHIQTTESNEQNAFLLLFLHVGLQLLTEPHQAIKILREVHQCYDKSRQSNTDVDMSWIDVVTEILLGLICQPSHLARKVACNILSLLHEHVTRASVNIIIEVLVSNESDNELVFVDDRHEDDIDESSDDEELIGGDDSGLHESDVDDAFRKKVKLALTSAAQVEDKEDMDTEENDDDFDDNMSDMSDDAMIRLDDTLTQLFQSRNQKKDSSQKKKQLMNVKLRCLDLLEVLTQNISLADGTVIISLLKPLLVVMNTGIHEDTNNLVKRARYIYVSILTHKKHIVESSVDSGQCLELIQQLADFCRSCKRSNVVDYGTKGFMLVMKCILKLDNNTEPSMKLFTLLSSLLRDCLHKINPHLSEEFFKKIITTYQGEVWPLTSTLLESFNDSSVKPFKKTQAALMLSMLINKNLVQEIGEKKWNSSLKIIMTSLAKLIESMKEDKISEKMRNKRLYMILQVVCRCLNADSTCVKVIPPKMHNDLKDVKMLKESRRMWGRIERLAYRRVELSKTTISKKRDHAGKTIAL